MSLRPLFVRLGGGVSAEQITIGLRRPLRHAGRSFQIRGGLSQWERSRKVRHRMETESEALHPSAATLVRDGEDVREDMAYFRKLGIPYDPKSLIEVLTRHKPKSAMPVACHSLADMRAKEAIPVLKTLADFPMEDVKATSVLAVARLCGKDETPWLVECLTRKGTLKGYVLWALAAVADPMAYPAVKAWFAPQLRKLERNPEADSV